VEATRLLQAVFNLGPEDMSIRPFSPEDFLVLCRETRDRDRMVAAGIAQGPAFSLALRGWIRQAHATAVDLPFLLPLELKGVPADAWTRHTADVLLDGVGFVVDVDAPTAHREDMSSFRVWVRALDPSRVPSSRPLFIEEPPAPEVRPRGRHRGPPPSRHVKTLRYDVRFRPLAEAVLADAADSPPPPQPPAPPARSPSPPTPPFSPSQRVDTPSSGRSGGFSAHEEVSPSDGGYRTNAGGTTRVGDDPAGSGCNGRSSDADNPAAKGAACSAAGQGAVAEKGPRAPLCATFQAKSIEESGVGLGGRAAEPMEV
jgi:hypothetical protein